MYEFYINSEKKEYEKDIALIDYIRTVLNITSVKCGCTDQSCGSCMVLIDGKAKKSCHIMLSEIQGKYVTTVDGISDREKEVYVHSFKSVGAVQCGYCTPSMVLCAKSLIDEIELPTKIQIKKAISENICRCTGYTKIEEAIELAAKILKDDSKIQKIKSKGKIGDSFYSDKVDDKILGRAVYTDDIMSKDIVYASALRIDIPRAMIKSIDYSEALKHNDIVAIVDKTDLKKELCTNKNRAVFVGVNEETKCLSDAICLVASTNKKSLEEIKKLIKVEYEALKPITTIDEAIRQYKQNLGKNSAKKIKIKRGNFEEKLENSKYIITNEYILPSVDHAYIETESAIAYVEGDTLVLHSSMPTSIKHELENILDIEKDKIRVVTQNVGGDFGGKSDMILAHHCAIMALKTGKKVKMTFDRRQSVKYHSKKPSMQIKLTVGCDEDGTFTGIRALIATDIGAYDIGGKSTLERACTHISGPYNYKNVDIKGISFHTNNVSGGKYRGEGVDQVCFAIESSINELAQLAGISAWDIRYKNAVETGDILPNGQIVDSDVALKETLISIKDYFFSHDYVGVACSMKNIGEGSGLDDRVKCMLLIKNEKIIIKADIDDNGQGIDSVLIQTVCETVNISPDIVSVEKIYFEDTKNSKHTFFIVEALRRASMKLESVLKNSNLKKLNGKYFIGEYFSITDPITSQKENPVSHISYAYATHCVSLDEYGRVKKVLASHDVGKAINPKNIEGQIQGGVAMSLGYALTEKLNVKKGVIYGGFEDLGVLNSTNMPIIEPIIVEKNLSRLAYGAKSVADISAIPTCAAVQGAYIKFDGIFRTKLPLEETYYNKKKVKTFKLKLDKIKF